MGKNLNLEHETRIVCEANDLMKKACTVILKADPTYWGAKLPTVWAMRVALIRHILILKLDYEMKKKNVYSRVKDIDSTVGSSVALRDVEAAAGIPPSTCAGAKSEESPLPPIMPLELRPLIVFKEVLEHRYFVKLSDKKDSIVINATGQGELIMCKTLHSSLLDIKILGRKFKDLEFIITTPWRIQQEVAFSMDDGEPLNLVRLPIPIVSTGNDEMKFSRVKFPAPESFGMGRFNLTNAIATFYFMLTPNSRFTNLVLAQLHDQVAPIEALSITFRFDESVRSLLNESKAQGAIAPPYPRHDPLPPSRVSSGGEDGVSHPELSLEGPSTHSSIVDDWTRDYERASLQHADPNPHGTSDPASMVATAPPLNGPESYLPLGASVSTSPITSPSWQSSVLTLTSEPRMDYNVAATSAATTSHVGDIQSCSSSTPLPVDHPFHNYLEWDTHVADCLSVEQSTGSEIYYGEVAANPTAEFNVFEWPTVQVQNDLSSSLYDVSAGTSNYVPVYAGLHYHSIPGCEEVSHR